jgi:outer membrane protein
MRKLFTSALVAVLAFTAIGAFAQAKISVVDTMKVADQSKLGKKIQAELKAYHDKKQQEISAKEATLKSLEEKAKDPKISEDKKDELKSEFNQKMYEYQAYAKAAQDDMQQRGQKMQQEFQVKLAKVIAQYAQSKGLSVVVEKGICLYNAEALDITPEIINAMNQAYPGT